MNEDAFVTEEVSSIAKDTIEEYLGSSAYQHSKVNEWSSAILEGVTKKLIAMNKPYKYMATCVISQKVGAGLHAANSCYWDSSTDGLAAVTWESKTIYCVLTVFGFGI